VARLVWVGSLEMVARGWVDTAGGLVCEMFSGFSGSFATAMMPPTTTAYQDDQQ
jgi:ammonia channel protein AmtB